MLRLLSHVAAITLAFVVAWSIVAASATLIVEDWRQLQVGAAGVPSGWLELPPLQRTVRRGALDTVEDNGRRALRIKTGRDEHLIIRQKMHVDLAATPVLEWQWKVIVLPTGADLRQRPALGLAGGARSGVGQARETDGLRVGRHGARR